MRKQIFQAICTRLAERVPGYSVHRSVEQQRRHTERRCGMAIACRVRRVRANRMAATEQRGAPRRRGRAPAYRNTLRGHTRAYRPENARRLGVPRSH